MTTYLKMEGYENYLVDTKHYCGGTTHRFKFDNGYGAIVIKHMYSHGGPQKLWELVVIRFDKLGNFKRTYDTEITDDVVKYQTDEKIRDLLERIKNLDNPKNEET